MKVIRTEADLDKAVDQLPVAELKQIVKQIATLWFVKEEDGALDIDKPIGSDELEAVTQALSSRGLYPTKE